MRSSPDRDNDYWWECPSCGGYFKTEDEAEMCQMVDDWPEDARFHMRYGLVELPEGLFKANGSGPFTSRRKRKLF